MILQIWFEKMEALDAESEGTRVRRGDPRASLLPSFAWRSSSRERGDRGRKESGDPRDVSGLPPVRASRLADRGGRAGHYSMWSGPPTRE